jgi:ubiquitin C-terminal hydrolase
LNSTNAVIDYYLKKIDICDTFLLKGILNKCNENILDNKDNIFDDKDSHKTIFQIIIFILKYLDNNQKIIKNNNYLEDSLYMKIWKILNKYHKLEFLQTKEIKYNDVNRKEFVGLENMSSTCYLNSILQQFFMIPLLRETILSIGNEEKVHLEPNTILYQLQLLFASLKTYDFKYYDPKYFVLVSKLSFYEQMDAEEYYSLLIDKLEDDISNLYNKGIIKNNYKDLFKYFFGIKFTDELSFIECNHKRFNESFYYNIQLEVKNYSNIYDSLNNYFKIEIMSGDNKINCEECNIKRVCHKQLKIKNLPNILVISLKRFDYDYRTMRKFKLNNYFEFPFELDLKEYLIEENQEINTTYELTGITIHFGFSDYGHYYDLIKSPNGKWYKFNDNCVYEFDEKDIPQEAFGEKESEDDFLKDIEEKDSGQNNAYILIYKKKIFDFASIENISKNYNCNLVLPPYDKYTNINDEIKSIINKQMFKFWTLQSIISAGYQNFVINLLKIDLVQNIITKKTENMHHQLFNNLKEEGYIISNKVDKIKTTNNKIFEFGLKYFFNIVLRIAIKPKDNLYLPIFSEIIKLYIESDLNKAKFILEEFSNSDIINEFLVYCCIKSGIMTTHDIIYFSFKKLFDNIFLNSKEKGEEINDDLNFLFKFINTYVLFISYNIHSINIENVNSIFYKILKISSLFINYLKDKKLEKWIMSFYADDDEDEDENIYLNAILSEDVFPKLKSNHKILTEKKMIFDGVNLDDNESENEFDTQNINRLKDTSGNSHLIRKLYYDFNVE